MCTGYSNFIQVWASALQCMATAVATSGYLALRILGLLLLLLSTTFRMGIFHPFHHL